MGISRQGAWEKEVLPSGTELPGVPDLTDQDKYCLGAVLEAVESKDEVVMHSISIVSTGFRRPGYGEGNKVELSW